jgi:hypothetical protein
LDAGSRLWRRPRQKGDVCLFQALQGFDQGATARSVLTGVVGGANGLPDVAINDFPKVARNRTPEPGLNVTQDDV